ncbi:MAG: AMP-binding protein, partial [Chloroflexi bacterium]|nr:AMP-binding protein [Chloroflexota bacterium]
MTRKQPDPRSYGSLLEILEDAAVRGNGRRVMALRTDAGTDFVWSAAELLFRARLAAWRLRAIGMQPGDRLLTWSPSTPELPAVYFGAMIAGLVVVPLDLRMSPDAVRRITERSEARWLAMGTGPDAPDPGAAGLGHVNARTLSFLTGEPPHANAAGSDEGGLDDPFPPDWKAQLDLWPRPARSDLFEVIYTSGTTGHPKGVALTHGHMLSAVEGIDRAIPPREHRLVSMLPLSHLFEQAPALFYGLMVGVDVLYVRSRNPRVVFEALRDHRVTTMVLVPLVIELFWNALRREVDKRGKTATFDRIRRIARHLPYPVRRLLFRQIHRQLGGELRLLVSAGAYLSPELVADWQSIGVPVLQGYGATECGVATATEPGKGLGTVGRPVPPAEVSLAPEDSEILVRGPMVFDGYWRDPEATAAALDADGWYHTGDIGHFDRAGNLVLSGRKKNIIVLPSGLNVYPEDIELELAAAGLPHAVVLETAPGRIEAVVLSPDAPTVPGAPPASGAQPGS